MIRVPLLLQTSVAVLHRLNLASTKTVQPHTSATSGYDPDFREPIIYDEAKPVGTGTVRESARQELPPIRIECQVEYPRFEDLQQLGSGQSPNTVLILVLHRTDLEEQKLLDTKTGECEIRKGDRVSAIEYGPGSGRDGDVQVPIAGEGLYVQQVAPGSPGFGPGTDLMLVSLEERTQAL